MLGQVPIVAPFLGCLFGGFLYDTFLFTGDSPMNLPYMGLTRVWGNRTKTGKPVMV
jgi:aquaglyceroporin related protein